MRIVPKATGELHRTLLRLPNVTEKGLSEELAMQLIETIFVISSDIFNTNVRYWIRHVCFAAGIDFVTHMRNF